MRTKIINISDIARWDAAAFRRLYGAYYKRLVSYSFALSHDDASAEDIVQELFSQLLERRVDFSSIAALEFYLFSSVRNATISHLRHGRVVAEYVHNVSSRPDTVEAMNEEIFGEDIYELLFHAIDELPERVRQVFLMRIDGKTNRDIARQLKLSTETVKTYVKRGLAALRGKLGDKSFALVLVMLS